MRVNCGDLKTRARRLASSLTRRLRHDAPDPRTENDPADPTIKEAYQNVFINDLKQYTRIEDKGVLVVGCNRGLECELFHRHGAREIAGVDPAPGIGADFPRDYISYFNVSAEDMPFEDNAFDLVATFASLEHIPDPLRALQAMVRVTKRHGVVYCHGSSLWYSPFGHHLGDNLKDDPWIHVRKPTLKELLKHYDGGSRVISGKPLSHLLEYVANSPEFNRFSDRQYKAILAKLLESTSIIRVMFDMRIEYKTLLTPAIAKELRDHAEEDLLTESLCFILRKT